MADDLVFSRVHRFMVGDRVVWTSANDASVEGIDVTADHVGTVTGFGNDELTYLEVTFDDDAGVATLTEDELLRLPPGA